MPDGYIGKSRSWSFAVEIQVFSGVFTVILTRKVLAQLCMCLRKCLFIADIYIAILRINIVQIDKILQYLYFLKEWLLDFYTVTANNEESDHRKKGTVSCCLVQKVKQMPPICLHKVTESSMQSPQTRISRKHYLFMQPTLTVHFVHTKSFHELRTLEA